MVIWHRLAGFLVVGYLSMARSFAYLGIPPFFIGEIVLAAFLLLKPRVALGTWAASLLRGSPLNALGLALLVFITYGVWQVGRGVLSGSGLVYTLKFFVFNYYTLYLFFGIWVGLRTPDLLPRLVYVTAWVNGIYGLVYILALRDLGIFMPGYGGTPVPIFSPPAGQAFVIVGLLCFERELRSIWPVLLLNVAITLVWSVRADWLGVALGAFVWGLLTGRLGRLATIGVAALALLGIVAIADIRLPGRNAEVSLSEILARAVAPLDLELAKELSPNAVRHAGTAEWRKLWWEQIWISVHSRPMLEAFGHGYGFDLFSLAPEAVRDGQENDDVRTPHSIFYYALGYTGWVGLALFCLLQFAILRLLWRSYRVSCQPAGLTFWVVGMAVANFTAGFERPYLAIPLYLLCGMAIAPGLQAKEELDAHLYQLPGGETNASPRPASCSRTLVAR